MSTDPIGDLQDLADEDRWPRYLILVPSYGAGPSIRTVATMLSEMNYPAKCWRAVFISDQHETALVSRRSLEIGHEIVTSAAHSNRPRLVPTREAGLLLREALHQKSSSLLCVAAFGIRGRTLLWAWAEAQVESVPRGYSIDDRLNVPARQIIEDALLRGSRSATKVLEDTALLCGVDPETQHANPELAIRLALGELNKRRTRRALFRELRASLRNLPLDPVELAELSERVLHEHERLARLIATTYAGRHPATQTVLDEVLPRIARSNIAHVTRPAADRRNKALALNYGFEEASAYGWVQQDTQVMVIDCDSLVHASALALTSREMLQHPEPNAIWQLLPITTNNYAGRNWLVRSIIVSDSIAGPGRWARSVRTRRRPDLTAGSGMVMSAAFLSYLRRRYGEPWDTSIICEDARIVLSQYGLLDGASKLTRLVPAYVLEAAPEQAGVWATYRAFWSQRVRWGTGGMDEVAGLARARTADMLVSSINFEQLPRSARLVIRANLRRLRLLVLWTSDHIWWSGIALAPVLWVGIARLVDVGSLWILVVGWSLLIGFPALTLALVWKPHIVPLVPGGIGNPAWAIARTVPVLVVLAIPYVWPVIAAQAMFVLGFRRRLKRLNWNPATPKPQL